jgi:hypothetical protein
MSRNDYMIRRFTSIASLMDRIEEGLEDGRVNGASLTTRDSDWTGTESLEAAIKFARYGGWEPEGAPEFRRLFDQMIPKLRQFTDFNLDRFAGPIGDEVNVAAYVMGEPDHMMDWVPQESTVSKRALCLLIGHSVSAGCSAEELFVRGQAVLGLVEALSLLGFELEIWSEETLTPTWGVKGGKDLPSHYTTLCRLHAAGEIMDRSAIEFSIGNPSWLRRIYFASEECEEQRIRNHFGFNKGSGYGSIAPISHGELVAADVELNLGETWFNERYISAKGDHSEVAKAAVAGVIDDDADFDWDWD